MDVLVLWLCSFLAPDLARLGHDQFAVREAETARCSNIVSALLLPAAHPDPEVDYRVRLVRRQQLRWLSPEYVERVTYREDYGKWLDLFFCPGRNRICDADVWADLDWTKRSAILDRWGWQQDWWDGCPLWQLTLAQFREWCDYNRRVAPPPREVPIP